MEMLKQLPLWLRRLIVITFPISFPLIRLVVLVYGIGIMTAIVVLGLPYLFYEQVLQPLWRAPAKSTDEETP